MIVANRREFQYVTLTKLQRLLQFPLAPYRNYPSNTLLGLEWWYRLSDIAENLHSPLFIHDTNDQMPLSYQLHCRCHCIVIVLELFVQFIKYKYIKLIHDYKGFSFGSRSAVGNIGAFTICISIQSLHEIASAIVCISTLYIRCNTHTLEGRCSSSPRDDLIMNTRLSLH